MSATIIAHIFERCQTSKAESQLLAVIARAGNAFGQRARLSYEAMAARTGFSRQYVITLVKRLEAKHLLRVVRQKVGPALNAINIYSVVRPWVQELSIREMFQRKQAGYAAQMASQQIVVPNPNQRENLPQTPTEADVIRLGRDPTSPFGKLLMGLPDTT